MILFNIVRGTLPPLIADAGVFIRQQKTGQRVLIAMTPENPRRC